eukprot:11758474-Alexandrium_andersonii.AAC.1
MEVGALALESSGGEAEGLDHQQLEAAFALLRRAFPGKGKGEGGESGHPPAAERRRGQRERRGGEG